MPPVNSLNNSLNVALNQSTELNQSQSEMLNQKGLSPEDKSRMEAQMKLQNYQELVSFISNVMKKRSEIAMSVINNTR